MRRTLLTRLLPTVITVGLVAALWVTLAPPQLGGRTMLATSYGSSMEPMLERGDVLILRKGDPAEVGDVVGYQSALLGRLVVHRVHRIEDGRLVMKGDNNTFLDPDLVKQSEVVGHLVLHVPAAGFLIEEVRKPQSAAAFGVFAAFFLVGFGGGRRRRDDDDDDEVEVDGRGPSLRVLWHGHALWAIGSLAVAAAVVAAVGFGRDAESSVRAPLFTQKGTFSYSAPAAGDVYPGGPAGTGDTIFLAATRSLALRFDYARTAGDLAGSAGLVADVESTNGWRHSITLEPAVKLGRKGTVTATLDLAAVRSLLDRLEARTGLVGAPYDVRIRARIGLLGEIRGSAIRETWSPELRFALDAVTLAPVRERIAQTRTATAARMIPAEVALGPVTPTVRSLRLLGIAGLVLASLLFALVTVLERRTRVPGAAAAIARRLRHGMVDVDSIDVSEVAVVVELGSIDELIVLAEEYQRLVLHQQHGTDHTYTVVEGGTVYRYLLHGPSPALAVAA